MPLSSYDLGIDRRAHIAHGQPRTFTFDRVDVGAHSPTQLTVVAVIVRIGRPGPALRRHPELVQLPQPADDLVPTGAVRAARTLPVGTASTIGSSELTRFDAPLELARLIENHQTHQVTSRIFSWSKRDPNASRMRKTVDHSDSSGRTATESQLTRMSSA